VAQKPNPVDPDSEEAEQIRREFGEKVNMTASELEEWLSTDESKEVGQKDGGESVGHESGRKIVKILQTNMGDLKAADIGHMKKVNGYVSRHLEQRPDKPEGKLEDAAWTKSLKNWGHDPLK
jgi:Protein of unknown function (DUF3140)